MIILRILNSPYANDLTRNAVLSHQDVDNNFIYLKGNIIYAAENNNGLVTLKKYNGEDIVFSASTGGSGGGGGSDSYWTSGSTGVGSIKAVNTTGLDATGTNAVAINHATLASGQFSFATGVDTIASGASSSTFGVETVAGDVASHAEGFQTKALREYSHAEGLSTLANAPSAHAEGEATIASGSASHAEGASTTASGNMSHAEGGGTKATFDYAHAEGYQTIASGSTAHSEGSNTVAGGDFSHSEGAYTIASGPSSHAEGFQTTAISNDSHAEGRETIAGFRAFEVKGITGSTVKIDTGGVDLTTNFQSGKIFAPLNGNITSYTYNPSLTIFNNGFIYITLYDVPAAFENFVADSTDLNNPLGVILFGVQAHAEGYGSFALGDYSHSEGENNVALGLGSHAEGQLTIAAGSYSHAEGILTTSSGSYSHAEGHNTIASGPKSHAEGFQTEASGEASHAEGGYSVASDANAHAEGYSTIASGGASHAEGGGTLASNSYSHAEGQNTIASGTKSHAEGYGTQASGEASHAEGAYTIASGNYSHAGGLGYNDIEVVVASGETSFAHQKISGNGYYGNKPYGAFGESSAILGGIDNNIDELSIFGTVLGGHDHLLYGYSPNSSILGGEQNIVIDSWDTVILGGSESGTILADNSAIIGGYNNVIDNFNGTETPYSFIGAGSNNKIQNNFGNGLTKGGVIMGGDSNTIGGVNSFNGIYNSSNSYLTFQSSSVIISSVDSFIDDSVGFGSYNNTIIGAYNSSIVGNGVNYASIFGGADNTILQNSSFGAVLPNYSMILGGNSNNIEDTDTATILNGYNNSITSRSKQSTIINGQNHSITSSQFSAIIGGNAGEMTDSDGSAIIGGSQNKILSDGNPAFTRYYNAILGGTGNTINNSELSFIMGGYQNVIPYGKVGVVILGGDSITGSTNNTVYVQRLNIKNAVNDNTTTRFLTLDANNNIAFRNLSSISGSSSGSTGGDTLWASGTTGTGSIKAINTTGLDANGNYAVAINNATMADGDNSFAAGYSTWARGTSSMSVGQNTESFGNYSFAGGHNTISQGNNSFIWSTESTVTGERSAVIGGSYINGLSADTVYVPYLNIQSATTDNTLTTFLVRNGDGVVKTKTLNSDVFLTGTPFYLVSSPTTDAGTNKTSDIQRNGNIFIGDYNSSTGLGTHTFISKSAIGITSTGFTYFSLNAYTNNNSIAPRYSLYRQKGTQTTPLNLSKGDTLGQISFQTSASGSISETLIDNYIIVSANENHGGGTIGTSGGTIMDIYLTQNGQNTSTKVLSIDGKGDTRILGNLTATTISATTYYNLPNQTSVTGFTYSNNNLTIKQSSGELNVLVNTMTGLTINGNLTFTGQSNNPIYTAGTTTSTFIPNWDNSNIQHVILSAATTSISGGTNIKNGAVYTMIVKQNATGSRVVTWGTQYKWQSGIAPVLTATANAVDIFTFISDGTNLYGLIAKDFR